MVVPEVEVPDPLEPYLSILLLDFNEEDYAKQPAEDGVEDGGIGDSEATNKLKDEVGMSLLKCDVIFYLKADVPLKIFWKYNFWIFFYVPLKSFLKIQFVNIFLLNNPL